MKDPGDSSEGECSAQPEDATRYSVFQRAKQGDEDAWRDIQRIYKPMVKWHCWRARIRSEEDVKDVLQNVFAALFKAMATFEKRRPVGGFRCWLRKTTLNQGRAYLKKQRKGPQAKGGSEARQQMEALPAADQGPSPEEEAACREATLSKEEEETEFSILTANPLPSMRDTERTGRFGGADAGQASRGPARHAGGSGRSAGPLHSRPRSASALGIGG